MEDVRLYLEGQLVDIDPNSVIAETKQVNTLFSLQERNTSYSQMFNVLLTKDTLKVLDNVGKPYSRSKKPYGAIGAQVYRGSTATVVDGNFYIKEIKNIKECESAVMRGNIMNGIIGLFDILKDRKLSELDFSELNHNYNKKSIDESKNYKWQQGYIYLSGNYGYTGSTGNYEVPSVFLKWLWEKIFEDPDISYEYVGANNVFETELFKNVVITVERHPIEFDPKNGGVNYNPDVKFEDLFLTFKQRDIIMEVCRMFGLSFRRNRLRNHYEFISYNDLFDLENSVDYSDKLFGTTSIKYNFGEYGKQNWFRWKYDEKENDENDYFFTSSSAREETKDVVKSKFKSNTGKMKFIDFNGVDENGIAKLKTLKTTPYILDKSNNASADDNERLKWENLIKDNYPKLQAVLDYQEVREVQMQLTAQDVRNFDLFKLVYLSQYQCYYYCNRIVNYVGNKTTKVELIRVSGIEP